MRSEFPIYEALYTSSLPGCCCIVRRTRQYERLDLQKIQINLCLNKECQPLVIRTRRRKSDKSGADSRKKHDRKCGKRHKGEKEACKN